MLIVTGISCFWQPCVRGGHVASDSFEPDAAAVIRGLLHNVECLACSIAHIYLHCICCTMDQIIFLITLLNLTQVWQLLAHL